ncbi:putative ABC transport system permease protein [Actinopolyspora alba]|uniref:Putative ABC transport system permease protein n=1 Tax=Actinopolyspora alba TaxID=673379 RepID=A0A1I2BIB8_9ACTN|nr:ABC transporter permease [Actinopolyspora alba]SFE55942.1 putative ABC transport system permease protein [Actinopolyspora alba]
MFVAIRDIRFAKGRFALMGSVVALITLLIVLLSGLTSGLADRSVSAVRNLPATHLVFGGAGDEQPEKSFADSTVTPRQRAVWENTAGVRRVSPLGITTTRVGTPNGSEASATVFGLPPDAPSAPTGTSDSAVVISRSLAEEQRLHTGDRLSTTAGELPVSAITSDEFYSHTPVIWTTLDTWRELRTARSAGAETPLATVLSVEAEPDARLSEADSAANTLSATVGDSLEAVGSFSSENGSLLTMRLLLYAISALVIGAFLTVWTIQRSGDVAVLKALGGSTGYLLRDALAQSLIVLLAGAGLGGAAGVALGSAAGEVVPFELTARTTLVPVLVMIALGMVGAALAVRRITSVEPLTALGAGR